MEGLEQKAKASGACQLVVKDLQEEFVRDFIFPCLRAGAIYERKYLLGTSMARPVIAKVGSPESCCLVVVFRFFSRIKINIEPLIKNDDSVCVLPFSLCFIIL